MIKLPVIAKKVLGLNPVLIVAMYALLIFSIDAIESAARHQVAGGAYFADRQVIWIILGSVIYFLTALIDYKWLKWLCIPMYILATAMMVVVLSKGSSVHQISVAGISFQPTQLMIGAGILIVALLFEQLPELKNWLNHPFIKLAVVAIFCGIPFLMVVKSGDMGSALVWAPIAVVSLFVGGIPYRYLTIMAVGAIGILPILYYIVLPSVSDRATGRIDQYINMVQNDGEVKDIQGDDYAIHYVTTAIGKAGWKGLDELNKKLDNEEAVKAIHANGFIPKDTAHNDYIFGVIGEELGFRGGFLLIMIFLLLIVTCLVVGLFSKDAYGLMVSCGVATLIFAHVFENIGMCIRVMPITGIPLPFVSYSGSFTLVCMLLLGFVQSIWIHRVDLSNKDEDRRRVRMLNL